MSSRHSRESKKFENLRKKERFREFLRALKESHPCTDCHLFYPAVVMEYDHVRGLKSYDVSKMSLVSLGRVAQEIDKCDLVCANCHRLRHLARKLKKLQP